MQITLEAGPFGTFIVRAADSQSRLVQSDWDYPSLATSFGWVACPCSETDGTVDCPHRTARDMMSEAYEFLRERLGSSIEDPGYFS